MKSKRFCYKNGEIPGVVIYLLEDSIIDVFYTDNGEYHGFHVLGVTDPK